MQSLFALAMTLDRIMTYDSMVLVELFLFVQAHFGIVH